jgi:protein SCO1/2
VNRQTFPIGTLFLFGLLLLVMWTTWLLIKPPAPPVELEGVLRSEYRPLAPFSLVDQHRQPFDESSLRGKWSLLFFGYLSCPDVCPTTLHELDRFWRLLRDQTGSDPADLQVVFVSVDPARDSPGQLGSYVGYFNRHFIAATGEKSQIDRLAQQFGASYAIEAETAPGQYQVAHSSAIFVVDPLGRSVAALSQPHYASTLLTQYRRITRYFAGVSAAATAPGSGLVARTRFLPLPVSPDEIGSQQHQVDDDADREKTDRRFVAAGRRGRVGLFAMLRLNIAQVG